MKKFANYICEHKNLIIGLTVILFVLSLVGNALTHINYDILVYLPEDIETIKGQNILTDDFNMGGYSIAVMEGMNAKDIVKLQKDLREIEGVGKVISLYDVVASEIPIEFIPTSILSKLHAEDTDLLFITFTDSTSSETTLNAVQEIRDMTENHVKLGGMSSLVLDTMNLSNKEIAIYIAIAVVLCLIVLELALDSYIVPVLLLANIGVAIIFNLGSNIFLGQISYITKALVAVLQLGVTTDFSIFLYHSYEAKKKTYKTHEEAMVEAICETFTSVTGSSLTTIIGFLVLCTMNLTLGSDLGIVMAKGVALGVVTVLTLFPSLLLVCDKIIDKTRHKVFIPNFSRLYDFVIAHHKWIFASFLIVLVPIYLANSKVDVYYKIDKTLPDTLESIEANQTLKDKFDMVSMEIVLLDKDLKQDDMNAITRELENTEGIDFVLSPSKLQELAITNEMLPEDLQSVLASDKYQMLMFNSLYDIATDELNEQVAVVDEIVKKYDEDAIVAGEGPLMKDLIQISDEDFNNVNVSSILCIFLSLFVVLKSLSLPFLLITAIEAAIFLNMGVSYFGGNVLPFVAPIVLGTIQLGATIDYAILMTTTYLKERKSGIAKMDAMRKTLEYSGNSIFVSGMCFFAATFGVGVYSELEMVGSLCTLISRGAIISMLAVITVLPSILLIFDTLIMKTTFFGKEMKKNMKKTNLKKLGLSLLGGILLLGPVDTQALTKDETVYAKLNHDGSVADTFVNAKLINDEHLDKLEDYTILKNILNLSNDANYEEEKDKIIWNSYRSNIAYRGTVSKELPIKVQATYYLDDEEHEISEMLGKSGKVKIVIAYENIDKHNVRVLGNSRALYTPFTVMMGTIIDDEQNSNITVDNGKIINNGSKTIVIGVATPGLYESLNVSDLKGSNTITISFDTEHFELASIYSLVTPKMLTSADVSKLDGLSNLYTKVTDLQNGIDKIQTGVDELATGSGSLSEGISNLATGLNSAQAQFQALKNGSVTLDEGISHLVSTLDGMMMKVGSLMSEADNLMSSFNANTIADLASLIETNDMTIREFETIINSLPQEVLQNLLTEEMKNKLASLQTLHASNEQALKNIEELASKLAGLQNGIAELKGKLANIQTIEENLDALNKGSNELKTGIDAFDERALKVLVAGSNSLKNGSNALYMGIDTLKTGITTYNEEGIAKITRIVNGDVKEMSSRIEALVKLGEEYDSFGGKLTSTKGETKFVMVIDGEKEEKKSIEANESQEKISLWQRFINLFK